MAKKKFLSITFDNWPCKTYESNFHWLSFYLIPISIKLLHKYQRILLTFLDTFQK